MNGPTRKVAIIGGSRIPFCRSNTFYADKSNMDMLTAAIDALVQRFGLDGEQPDEVQAGAVITHSKDFNLAREAVLSSGLSNLTPGITLGQACGTSLQAALNLAGKIATGQIESGIAAGTDTTSDAPIVFGKKFSSRLIRASQARSPKQSLKAFKGFGPGELKPVTPTNSETRTGLSMGQHCERMAQEWEIARADQDRLAYESHQKAAAAYDEGFFDALVTPWSGVSRDNILRTDTTIEKLAALRTVFEKGPKGTLSAGNSTTLSDGASAVLLASEEWAKAHDLPVQAYLVAGRSAAIDHVNDEGLLMAPTIAVAEMLQRAELKLQDFDLYEIHEAFAAQVLCTLKAWESEDYCRDRLGLEEPLGGIDPEKMNVKGGSLALGHPFAATGGRILGTLAQLLEDRGSGRGLISVCTAGGMGVSAILERP
ncbi:MAG: acetyl-CoA C-acetyltransferase [Lysobacterales bacterium]|jgi:acetyl-CoA C-acetyltransferase